MTVQAHPTLRAIVLPAVDADPKDTPTRRLLDELGHDVTRAASPGHALELLNADPTDLLVIDVTNSKGNRDLIAQVLALPAAQKPKQVAIFTDRSDAELRDFRKKMTPAHVHVFLKPLHVHGLLKVLRQIERQSDPDVPPIA